ENLPRLAGVSVAARCDAHPELARLVQDAYKDREFDEPIKLTQAGSLGTALLAGSFPTGAAVAVEVVARYFDSTDSGDAAAGAPKSVRKTSTFVFAPAPAEEAASPVAGESGGTGGGGGEPCLVAVDPAESIAPLDGHPVRLEIRVWRRPADAKPVLRLANPEAIPDAGLREQLEAALARAVPERIAASESPGACD